MEDDLEGNTSKVLHFIQENPGCHLRKIKRDLKLSMGTIQYHLNLLEQQGKVYSEKQNFHKYYFPIGLFEQNERNILKILNHDTAKEILMIILEKKEPTQSEIAQIMKISSAAVGWHVKRMKEHGLINEVQDGKSKRYLLAITPQEIISLMKNYHPNIWSKWSNRLAEIFLSMSMEKEK